MRAAGPEDSATVLFREIEAVSDEDRFDRSEEPDLLLSPERENANPQVSQTNVGAECFTLGQRVSQFGQWMDGMSVLDSDYGTVESLIHNSRVDLW